MKIQNKLQYIATPAKVFLTVLIILIAVSILQGICIEIENTNVRKKRYTTKEQPEAELSQEEKRQKRLNRSLKEFLPDGTIHLIDRVEHISGRRDKVHIYDINDNLLWEGPSDKKPYEYLSWAEQLQNYEAFSQWDMKRIQTITPVFSRYIGIPVVGSEDKTRQLWCYNPGTQYFKGYDIKDREIGYIGSNGLIESKSKVKPFGEFRQFATWCPLETYNLMLLWQTQKKIYQINFEKQEVELIFESKDADIEKVHVQAWIDVKSDAEEYVDPDKYRPLIHCKTRDGKHHLILREPKEQFSFNLPRPSFSVTKQEIFVRNYGNDMPPVPDINSSQQAIDKWVQDSRSKSWNYWTELYKVKNNGELELMNRYDYTSSPISGFESKKRDPRPPIHRHVCQFSPGLYDLITYLSARFLSRSYLYQNRGTLSYDLLLGIQGLQPYRGMINRILSALMMVLVFWHGWPRRTSWTRFVFWLVFTGLLNITGLLTYLALNHTAVIKCPICSKQRELTQVECVRCQAQLPAPERGKLDLIFSV
ncbi:MAG: hypothetical protein ACYS6K_28460 [Planctomycetota bacterium]|jgi:hypothetical protein